MGSEGVPLRETRLAFAPNTKAMMRSWITLTGIMLPAFIGAISNTTPYSMSGNFTLQYQLTPTMSVEAAYVGTYARHLTTFTNRSNNVSQILPVSANPSAPGNIPFPHFARGSNYLETVGNSYYHGLQTKLEKRFSGGLDFLATYTYSKVRSDAIDNLNNAGNPGYRASNSSR